MTLLWRFSKDREPEVDQEATYWNSNRKLSLASGVLSEISWICAYIAGSRGDRGQMLCASLATWIWMLSGLQYWTDADIDYQESIRQKEQKEDDNIRAQLHKAEFKPVAKSE